MMLRSPSALAAIAGGLCALSRPTTFSPRGPVPVLCSPSPIDGTFSVVELVDRLKGMPGKVAAVYAVADEDGLTRFVGTSRDVAASLAAHLVAVPERCSTVRLQNVASSARAELVAAKREWIAALGYTPEGNGDGSDAWVNGFDRAREGRAEPARGATAAATDPVSPFASPAAVEVARPAVSLELSVENVDMVLDEVRPYLISDGGNVAVVGVDAEARTVSLELEGACGSCASSKVTMAQGIERRLRETWPDLAEIVEVGAAAKVLSADAALEALSPIMPAVEALGGSVRVISAEESTVVLGYSGPEKLKLGIELALKDSPLITRVDFA